MKKPEQQTKSPLRKPAARCRHDLLAEFINTPASSGRLFCVLCGMSRTEDPSGLRRLYVPQDRLASIRDRVARSRVSRPRLSKLKPTPLTASDEQLTASDKQLLADMKVRS